MSKIFKVAEIIDDYTLVINAGENQNIKENQRFLIFSLDGKEVYDPDTKELLGCLETTKGTATATSVLEKMTVIKSDMYRTVTSLDLTASLVFSITNSENSDTLKPGDKKLIGFKDVKIGDLVKSV